MFLHIKEILSESDSLRDIRDAVISLMFLCPLVHGGAIKTRTRWGKVFTL